MGAGFLSGHLPCSHDGSSLPLSLLYPFASISVTRIIVGTLQKECKFVGRVTKERQRVVRGLGLWKKGLGFWAGLRADLWEGRQPL